MKNIANETLNDPWIRYIRINYLKNSKTELMKKLEQIEFKQRLYSKNDIQFDQFKTIALSLAIDEYLVDYHFEDVFVFNDESTKKLTPLYEDGSIAMQDKVCIMIMMMVNYFPR